MRPSEPPRLRLDDGDRAAAAELFPQVYDELRRQAARYLRLERGNHTLQPTALVHEAYLKLANQDRARWSDRDHFCAVAAQAMRRILVDHARKHRAAKRGGGLDLTVSTLAEHLQGEVDMIELDEALGHLAELSERQSRVVELRFFGGLGVEEAAKVLDVSPGTVKRDWRIARAWLQRSLEGGARGA